MKLVIAGKRNTEGNVCRYKARLVACGNEVNNHEVDCFFTCRRFCSRKNDTLSINAEGLVDGVSRFRKCVLLSKS